MIFTQNPERCITAAMLNDGTPLDLPPKQMEQVIKFAFHKMSLFLSFLLTAFITSSLNVSVLSWSLVPHQVLKVYPRVYSAKSKKT